MSCSKIILASSSPRRRDLLKQISLDFEVYPAQIDEIIDSSLEAKEMVVKLAKDKALAVAKTVQKNSIVIGADTVVYHEEVLGKPKDERDAFHLLKKLSGKWHEVFTGLAVIETNSMSLQTIWEMTRVKFRDLKEEEIIRYIATKEPMDKAGGYGIQGLGALFVEKIEGCYFNVVGLPLQQLAKLLQMYGVRTF
jgi:septum formation protein